MREGSPSISNWEIVRSRTEEGEERQFMNRKAPYGGSTFPYAWNPTIDSDMRLGVGMLMSQSMSESGSGIS